MSPCLAATTMGSSFRGVVDAQQRGLLDLKTNVKHGSSHVFSLLDPTLVKRTVYSHNREPAHPALNDKSLKSSRRRCYFGGQPGIAPQAGISTYFHAESLLKRRCQIDNTCLLRRRGRSCLGDREKAGSLGGSGEESVDSCDKENLVDQPVSNLWRRNEDLKDHCTWGIGGKADFFIEVKDSQSLADTVRLCCRHGIRYIVIGNGSNCLFDSEGFRGCVILNRISFKEDLGSGTFRVGSGYPFNQLGVECSRDGFAGLEFASGIPGTVGGAVFMNAGAAGQETSESLLSVEIALVDVAQGSVTLKTVSSQELVFSYRQSSFQEDGALSNALITAATFKLEPSVDARTKQHNYMNMRRKTQPLLAKSAGSVFRNPPQGLPAGALIDKSGLKGYAVGGAAVSEVHANFLINRGSCTTEEMLQLMGAVKRKVQEVQGVRLDEEVRYISPYGHMPWTKCSPNPQQK